MTELAQHIIASAALVAVAFSFVLIFDSIKSEVDNDLVRLSAAVLFVASAIACTITLMHITAAIAFWLAG